jgi:hypothetical protein
MIKAFGFLLIAVTLLVTLYTLQQYDITYQGRPDLRQLIDYSENYLSSTCVVYEDHGTFFKGVFDKAKLDKNAAGCITFSKPVSIFIKDERGGTWNVVRNVGGQKLTYPIVVKYPDQFVLGTMEVIM